MAHDAGQKLVVRVLDMAPDTFNDMKVGPAYPRRTDDFSISGSGISAPFTQTSFFISGSYS